jgi:hypothetical protein
LNAIGVLLIGLFSTTGIIGSRRVAALSLLGASLYITQGEAINLGLNLFALRFIELAIFIRVIGRKEFARVSLTRADRWLLVFFGTLVVFNSIQSGAVSTYQLGTAVDGLMVYFSFRALITTKDEFIQFIKGTVTLLFPYMLIMAYEAMTGQNLFGIMGGVPAEPIMREGHYRCQGSFQIAITAGSLGATFIAIFVGFLFRKEHRKWAIAGIISCLGIVVASHSSGPLMAAATAVAGWTCWLVRRHMQWVRRGIVAVLLALQLTMSQPVWFIFDRISGVLGGDGWHRSNLIDKFIFYWREWWMVGMPFINTSHWAATQLPWGGVDVTNYYVSIGIIGGILPFAFFIKFIVECFRSIGRTTLLLQKKTGRSDEALVWGVGCTICAHVVNLTAVLYWDQSYVFWYLHLALAGSLTAFLFTQDRPISLASEKRSPVLPKNILNAPIP